MEDKESAKLSEEENNKRKKSYDNASIYENMSIEIVFGGVVQTITGIIGDLINYGQKEEDGMMNIFWKDDRMFFLGVFFLFITLILGILHFVYSNNDEIKDYSSENTNGGEIGNTEVNNKE